MRRLPFLAGATAVALAATAAMAVPSGQAAPAPRTRTLATGLVTPLSLAVAGNGTVYVTQNFAGLLTKDSPRRAARVVYRSSGGNEVGGVSVRRGRVIFTETSSGPGGEPADSWIKVLTGAGHARTLAHVRAWENRHNPDHRNRYGARGISRSCAAQWPTQQFGPATYRGLRDSHPYATWQTAQRTYVADAGMNAVIAVSPRGRISTVAVLPPVPVVITASMASQMHLPSCAVGLTYYGEPVPTDVQALPDGSLLVTTEGGGLGESRPLGSLYRIQPNGMMHKIVGHLFAPVGVAVGPRGEAYVSELFGGRIVRVRAGAHRARTFARVNMPAALDWRRGGLYATTDVLVGAGDPPSAPGGRVVKLLR